MSRPDPIPPSWLLPLLPRVKVGTKVTTDYGDGSKTKICTVTRCQKSNRHQGGYQINIISADGKRTVKGLSIAWINPPYGNIVKEPEAAVRLPCKTVEPTRQHPKAIVGVVMNHNWGVQVKRDTDGKWVLAFSVPTRATARSSIKGLHLQQGFENSQFRVRQYVAVPTASERKL